jgi:zinc transporter 7
VQDLNAHKLATSPTTSSLTSRIFAVLFPGSPAVNALLATLYISGPPNFLLALCPPDIDPSSLSVMVAFAVGGLLGDTLFHLLPEIFLGEAGLDHVRFVMVEPNRNLLLGVAIMVGFVTFVAMDKALRIATGGEGHDHSHGHTKGDVKPSAITSGADKEGSSARLRKKENGSTIAKIPLKEEREINASVKLAGYLNLMCAYPLTLTPT